MDIQTPFR